MGCGPLFPLLLPIFFFFLLLLLLLLLLPAAATVTLAGFAGPSRAAMRVVQKGNLTHCGPDPVRPVQPAHPPSARLLQDAQLHGLLPPVRRRPGPRAGPAARKPPPAAGSCGANNIAPAIAARKASGAPAPSTTQGRPPAAGAVSASASVASLACPFGTLGCLETFTQRQKQIDHTNGHKEAYGSDADLWCEVVLQAGLDALDADWGVCGLLIPNTAHGRKKHLDGCELCREEVAGAVRREHGGNESAYYALAGSPRSRSASPWPTRT